MPSPPKSNKPEYNNVFFGYYGKMGHYEYEVKYIQTVLELEQLDEITLIEKIPGSEKWGIRELFQRMVDMDRVEDMIMPYFLNDIDVKFFNPLTLSLIPLKNKKVTNDFTEKISDSKKDDFDYNIIEAKNYYRLEKNVSHPQYSEIKWNNRNCKLIAIDGQHRIAALKKLWNRYSGAAGNLDFDRVEFGEWKIPAIITIMPAQPHNPDNSIDKFNFLKSIRSIFVNINKEARQPSRTQNIILDDTSITAVCCQETLQQSQDGKTSIPIEFYDWRTLKSDEKNRDVECKVSFLRIDELEDYFINFLIGSDDTYDPDTSIIGLSKQQAIAFDADKLDPQPNYRQMGWHDAFRSLFADRWFKVFEQIALNFPPTKSYIEKIITMKKEIMDGSSESKKAALNYITFGTKPEDNQARQDMDDALKDIDKQFTTFKNDEIYKKLFNKIIGMRGIFSGFGHIYYDWYVKHDTRIPSEIVLSYIDDINEEYNNDNLLFESKLLQFFVRNHNNEVSTLYKFDDVNRRFGKYCALIHFTKQYDRENDQNKKASLKKIIDQYFTDIDRFIESGFRSLFSAEIKRKKPNIGSEDLKSQAASKAKTQCRHRIKELKEHMDFA